jgi:aldehyde:ferredoxin oxidoreductase
VADPEGFIACCSKLHDLVKESPNYEEYSKRGCLKSEYLAGTSGYAPAGNHQIFGWDKKAEFLDWWEKFGVKKTGCFSCPVQCAEIYTIPGVGSGVVSCQHYIEPTWKIKNDDVMVWWECVRNCQLHGVDVISITGILAWLMELYEDGIISKEDTDGIAMHWGDRDAIITMMDKIINREGIGDTLAYGFKEAVKQFGAKSESYAMHVKNSPLYNASPRFPLTGLEMAVGPRGDHMRAIAPFAKGMIKATYDPNTITEERDKIIKKYQDQAEEITGTRKAANIMGFEGKPKAVIYAETNISISDMLGICKYMGIICFHAINPENLAEVFSVGSRKSVTPEELIIAATRNRNLERAFEAKEGLTRKDDTLPKREFNKDIGGRYKGVYLDRNKLEKAKDEYYALRGWDITTGIPTWETLVNLGLRDVAEDLKKRKIILQ